MSDTDCRLRTLFPLTGTGQILGHCVETPGRFVADLLNDCSISIKASAEVDFRATQNMLNQEMNAKETGPWKLHGETETGYLVECSILDKTRFSCSMESDPISMKMNFVPYGRLVVKKSDLESHVPKRIIFGILNMQQEAKGALHFRVGKYDVTAEAVANYKFLEKKLEGGEVPRAITFEFALDMETLAEIDQIEKVICNLTLMMRVIKHNEISPFYSIVENVNGTPVLCTIYSDLHTADFVPPFFRMIHDKHIAGGTESYANHCFERFSTLHEDMNLYPFIDDQLFAAKSQVLERNILVLILGLEYLVTRYGRKTLEWNLGDKMDLIQKLKRLNNHIKCIPSHYLQQNFLTRVRNPLIHSGALLDLSHDELWEICRDLHRLTALVYLKLLDYRGAYLGYDWPPTVFTIN